MGKFGKFWIFLSSDGGRNIETVFGRHFCFVVGNHMNSLGLPGAKVISNRSERRKIQQIVQMVIHLPRFEFLIGSWHHFLTTTVADLGAGIRRKNVSTIM